MAAFRTNGPQNDEKERRETLFWLYRRIELKRRRCASHFSGVQRVLEKEYTNRLYGPFRFLLVVFGSVHTQEPTPAFANTHRGKPGLVLHTTRLTRGILRITKLIRKQSGSVTSTAMAHLSSG